MRYIRGITLSVITTLLIGCGLAARTPSIQNRDENYLSAKTIAPLRMPAGTKSNKIQNRYPVSEREFPAEVKHVDVVPPGLM